MEWYEIIVAKISDNVWNNLVYPTIVGLLLYFVTITKIFLGQKKKNKKDQLTRIESNLDSLTLCSQEQNKEIKEINHRQLITNIDTQCIMYALEKGTNGDGEKFRASLEYKRNELVNKLKVPYAD